MIVMNDKESTRRISDEETYLPRSGILVNELTGVRMQVTVYPKTSSVDIIFLLPSIDFCHVKRLPSMTDVVEYSIDVDSEKIASIDVAILFEKSSGGKYYCFAALNTYMKDGSEIYTTFNTLELVEINMVTKEVV